VTGTTLLTAEEHDRQSASARIKPSGMCGRPRLDGPTWPPLGQGRAEVGEQHLEDPARSA